MKPIRTLLCIVCLLSFSAAHAAVYYVSPDATGSGAGSLNSPWTLPQANVLLQAGDIVYLLGGTYIGQSVRPENSGLKGATITYGAYPGEVPVLTRVHTGIDLSDRSYITIDGIHINGEQIGERAKVKHWATLINSHHCTLRNTDFRYARGWYGILLEDESSFNKFLNNNFDYCGSWSDSPNTLPGQGDDSGDLFYLKCGKYNLIEGNTMKHGGHDLIVIDDSYNVIRHNTFDADWSDWGNGQDIGSRAGSFSARPVKNCSNGGTAEQDAGGYNIIEHNVFKNTGWFPDNIKNLCVKLFGVNQVFRYNRVGNNIGTALALNTRDEHPYSTRNKIYNNIFFNNTWRAVALTDTEGQGYSISDNVLLNNIIYNNGTDPYNIKGDKQKEGDILFWLKWLRPADPFDGNQIKHNLIYNEDRASVLFVKNADNKASLSFYERTYPAYVQGNVDKAPGFVAIPFDIDRESDFHLKASSPAVDKGHFLTKTVGQGHGKVLRLEDAGYFFDGYGLIKGDRLQVGTNAPVLIVHIDYSINEVRLEQPIAWEDGDMASLPYYGEAPDMGIFEYDDEAGIEIAGTLNFGKVATGVPAKQSVHILNIGQGPITVSELSLPRGFSSDWHSGTILGGDRRTVTITFQPTSESIYSGFMQLHSTATQGVAQLRVSGEGISGMGSYIRGFYIVDAVRDREIDILRDGDIIDMEMLPSNKINIIAKADEVTKIDFILEGAMTYGKSEGMAPYALFGDNGGDYKTWTPIAGNYTLKASAYHRNELLEKKTIHFEVSSAMEQEKKPILFTANATAPSLYPNPTRAMVHLSAAAEWQVLDLLGKVIAMGNGTVIDLHAYRDGTYLVRTGGELQRVVLRKK